MTRDRGKVLPQNAVHHPAAICTSQSGRPTASMALRLIMFSVLAALPALGRRASTVLHATARARPTAAPSIRIRPRPISDRSAATVAVHHRVGEGRGHSSCVVERDPTGVCDGPWRTVALPPKRDLSIPPLHPLAVAPTPATSPPVAAPPAVVAPAPIPANPGSAPPKTVEELARRTAESSQQGLKQAGDAVVDTAGQAGTAVTETANTTGSVLGKAGSAVGHAAKKSWDCVASLFKDC